MFKSFDFGKGLSKMVEAYHRTPLRSQQGKKARIVKAMESYATNYMAVVLKPGKANPGQLTNGAEALVEAALAVGDDRIAYTTFAELVARSKKVPVVPSLHTLVDKLLDLPTELKEERVALLSWRITTGSLAPERFLKYMSERAKLTGDPADWKDYAWGLDQLIKNHSLELADNLAVDHLQELLENKNKLGDRLIEVQLKMAETYLARSDNHKAEELLIEIASDSDQLTEDYLETVERLLQVRPGAEWGLHSMALMPWLAKFHEGKIGWTQMNEKLTRVQGHNDQLAEFLLGHDLMPHHDRLALFALRRLLKADDPVRIQQNIQRWTARHTDLKIGIPEGAAELINNAGARGAVDLDDEAVEMVVQQAPAKEAVEITPSLMDCATQVELELRLDERYGDNLTAETASELITELQEEGAAQWMINAAHRWVGEKLLKLGDANGALSHLETMAVNTPDAARELIDLVKEATGGDEPDPAARALIGKLELAAGNYAGALFSAEELADDKAAQQQLLTALETWIVAQSEPPPLMLLVLGQTQRLMLGDPEAGFEPATTASLLAPEDAEIAAAYQTWLDVLEENLIHRQRAQQATYLCAQENHRELLPVAVHEIDALTGISGDDLPPEPAEWLNMLRPVLDMAADEESQALRNQWTRLYLTYVAKSASEEEIPAAIQAAVEQAEPQLVLSIADELGVPVPAEARLMVECESLAKQGEWQRAVELIHEVPADGPTGLLPVKLLCDHLPTEALLPATEQLNQVFLERGDSSSQLELIRCLDSRLETESSNAARDVRDYSDENLLTLCRNQYEPAIRYLMTSQRQIGDPVEVMRHLTILARTGDDEALDGLYSILMQQLPEGEPADLLVESALLLAEARHDEDPAETLELLARTGQATNEPQLMLEQIDNLELLPDEPELLLMIGNLAVAAKNEQRALAVVNDLAALEAIDEARQLASRLAEACPESETVQRQLIKLQFSGGDIDYHQATVQLLKMAQSQQEKGDDLGEVVNELQEEIASAVAAAPDNTEALHLRLAVAALKGNREEATELIQRLLEHGPQAMSGLLELFENLAMQDTGLPTALVVTWGRILFMSGRTADALDRLAGLREAVGDYPEYTTLLKEIRDAGGGPGASMQLGEAYIRVNLWQRSAEEYSSALEQDPSLAIPILTQLRYHGALDPNPMQYPLHLLALRCVAESDRAADWGWAMSALRWLMPRWSAEELFGLATILWRNEERVELTTQQRSELLLQLFKLAIKLGQAEDALEYLRQAWDLAEEPGDELIGALEDMDEDKLPADSPHWIEFRELQLSAAVIKNDTQAVVNAAQMLAATGEQGRERSLVVLGEYQRQARDPGPVLLARLQLLDLSTDHGRQMFVDELLAAAETDLPEGEVHSLIRTVLELTKESTDSPGLTKLLLQLFRQLGDEARAWQLALSFIVDVDDLAEMAMEVLTQLAEDEYALSQQVALIEIHLLRSEYDLALSQLQKLDFSAADELGNDAARLAEALLFTSVEADARTWLVQHYRQTGQEELAADHLVWAHATSNPLPAGWLHELDSGEMLFRSGQLKELHGDRTGALKAYEQAREDDQASSYIQAAVRLRLSQLAEHDNDLQLAQQYNNEVREILPDYTPADRRAANLATAINLKRIEELKSEPESKERTIETARLLCAVGKPGEAIGVLQNGISKGQGSPEVSVELGECFHLQGDYRIALRVFADVLRKLETAADAVDLQLRALYTMASAHEKLGELDETIRYLEQILMLNHDYRDCRQRLESLYRGEKPVKPAAEPKPAQAEPDSKGQQEIIDEILGMLGLPDEPEQGQG
ncbi:hypothetical protein JW859_12040 [bacterium]|nr:hypothetical protein [bacterium]